ncbi:unnamed protein product [Phyllotreta striolata]|uniref:Nuclear speckle splicing regulatory protein 1 N-terminal domain-containing protein n=1 Tax=Phyllotreta striolata TaxID=444603 RepID=A0A9P0DP69_PHYSR|nr:unnamed protein product [Phyllotreta striolata]
MAKQYGLSFPKKNIGHQIGQVSTAKPSIFDEDSDQEEQVARPTGISVIKRQDLINQEKAVADDPTVYQYDEVYEEIEKKRQESKLARKDLDKKPKYVSKLLAAADKRKREHERRIERQVQREREEEGDAFKDKESFVTPSYKKKLEEMKLLDEQEKREQYLESIGDVRKQGNLDGFYRHLYDQKVNFEETPIKTEVIEENKEDEIDQDNIEDKPKKSIKERKYRSKRNSEDASNSEEEPEIKMEHLPSNLDADSDFSIDSSDSEEEGSKEKTDKVDVKKEETATKEPTTETPITNDEPVKTDENIVKIEKVEEVKPKIKKLKTDIWKKRTVGEKFDEALKRYMERKALREMGQ